MGFGDSIFHNFYLPMLIELRPQGPVRYNLFVVRTSIAESEANEFT